MSEDFGRGAVREQKLRDINADLLAALERLVAAVNPEDPGHEALCEEVYEAAVNDERHPPKWDDVIREAAEDARAAIAKARGQS